ncbi:MAG: hypothetical protein ABI743_11410, partial [bacterium]
MRIASTLGSYLIAMAMIPALMSCGGGTPPTAAATPPAGPPAATLTDRLTVAPHDGSVVFGATHLRLDDTGAVVVEPVRLNQAIGDAYMVGLNNLDALCQCFQVTGVSRDPIAGGYRLHVDLAFDHPFNLATRPDLFGWDLKAIVVSDSNKAVVAGTTAVVGAGHNAAGYTKEWTPEIHAALPTFTGDAYPYIILGEDRTAPAPFDFQNPVGWNVFPAGATNTGTLDLDVLAGQ